MLLVFTLSTEDENYLEQKHLLEGAEDGVLERDVVVLFVNDPTDPLRADYRISKDFTVVLIGKDGTEKERFSKPIEPERLFGLIDQMPMRRREMREQGE